MPTTPPSPSNDLAIVSFMKANLPRGEKLNVMLDKNARILAMGSLSNNDMIVMERRSDYTTLMHILPQGINEESSKSILSVIKVMNESWLFSEKQSLSEVFHLMGAQLGSVHPTR
jgi:hypothetical protein